MRVRLITVLFLLSFTFSLSGRIFFIGSNPYFSFIAYPQDIHKYPRSFIYYYPTYQKLPWWGDIDQPDNKPNPTYTSTEESIENPNNTFFEHKGLNRIIDNRIGWFYKFKNGLLHMTDIDYEINALKNQASGNFTNQNTNTTIPFDYQVTNSIHNFLIQSLFATTIGEIPWGFKAIFGFKNFSSPDVSMSFVKDNVSYTSERLLWGWSRAGCNHIFGPRGTEGDAWLQSNYAIGPLFRFDLQAGATLPKVKLGTRFRYITGLQDQYSWARSSEPVSDTIIGQNFKGTYVKSEWAKKSRDALLRMYGNIFWKKHPRYSLNTLVFLGLEAKTEFNALADNLEIEDDAKDKMRNVILEINPNINIYPGKITSDKAKKMMSYIDIGLLLEYSFIRFENVYQYNYSGGQTEAYRNSRVYVDDEYWYERFSYANENFLDVGLDLSTMLPLYGNAKHRLGLGLILFTNYKATWMKKYFGNNTINGSEVSFTTENLRKNFKHEIWFNSMYIIHYILHNVHLSLRITQPLLYSLSPRTRVTDASGDNVLYDHTIKGTWNSLSSVKLGWFFAYELF